MASASIIFDNSQSQLTLAVLLIQLQQALGLKCEMTEWKFGANVIPQIRIGTVPPIALQLDEAPEIVPEEIQELLDDYGGSFDEAAIVAARSCRSRLDVVSCEQSHVDRFPEGGILVHTPNADLDSASVQLALCQIGRVVRGLVFDNINGRWLNAK